MEPDSLVPKDDPTILFTPAGMNQFKKEFMGFDSGLARAATVQRCLRTDDLDKVGKTSGHHTFFEMLGNFSFGDYFKKEAISYAWEFLTEELTLDKKRLWVSVYKDDDEAYNIWKDLIKIAPEKIIKLGDKENFWPSEAKERGPNGPCGPCSEIFYDLGSNVGCKRQDCTPACDCGRFVEVWNLVFTQFNRKEGGTLEPLPKKNIDTGMGLERLAAVMQGVSNNFETDLFKPIIKEIILGLGFANSELRTSNFELIYAVADHIRAIAFAIYDGVLPSNEARGYVVRKIIRKSTLHLRALGFKHPFLYKLVPTLADVMESFYPDLKPRQENISQVILAEEKNFILTLNSSKPLFEEKFKVFLDKQNPQEAGKIVFQLYDTYGIPLELTQNWLKEKKISFSEESFDKELSEQKTRSKLQSAMKGDVFGAKGAALTAGVTKFLGYKEYELKAKILQLLEEGRKTKKITKGQNASIILDKSVFYAESGGQVGDTGRIIKGKNIFEVLDTKKSGKAILHMGRVKEGSFKIGDLVAAIINLERRLAIARNHTATHLLQAALRRVLGEHVQQQGSLVAEAKLRFDFTHFKDINEEELDRVEEVVNESIINNFPLSVKQMPVSVAKKTGALAFFGEKYEGKVRVISMGDFSKELCAGTHLENTGQIGLFKITHEASVASGVRRIEAVTGKTAYGKIKEEERIISQISFLLNVPKDKIAQELEKRLGHEKELEKKLRKDTSKGLESAIENDIKNKEDVSGINFVTHIDTNPDALKKSVDLIKQKLGGNTFIASTTGAALENKILWVLGATEDLCVKGIDASKLFSVLSEETGCSGGGRKDFAQGGGNNPANFQKALEKLKEAIKNIMT